MTLLRGFVGRIEKPDKGPSSAVRSPPRAEIFKNCYKRKDIRELYDSMGLFCRLNGQGREPPINTTFENLEKNVEFYREIERFGVENKMALRGVNRKEVARATAFRATYANMLADRIFDAVPYGKVYFRLIMAYYSVSRLNFGRLFCYQLGSLAATLLLLIIAVFMISGLESSTIVLPRLYAVATGLLLVVFFFASTVIYAMYQSAEEVNRAAIADKIGERIFHLITAEQTCLSRITADENSTGSDAEWRTRTETSALAAIAFRWRVFLLKQFLDVATHKILRRYVWLRNFTIPFIIVPIILLILVTIGFSTLEHADLLPDLAFARIFGGAVVETAFVGVGLILASTLTYFLWSADPSDTLNKIAERIGSADANLDVDTPTSIIVNLVGRVSNAKNEGRRN